MIEPTDEMLAAFRDAWIKSMAEDPRTDDPERIADHAGLAAVLAIVERDYEIEVAKLRGACKLAGKSRELWKQRALDAGWTS